MNWYDVPMENFPANTSESAPGFYERNRKWIWDSVETSAKVLGGVALALVAGDFIAGGLDVPAIISQHGGQIAVSLFALSLDKGELAEE